MSESPARFPSTPVTPQTHPIIPPNPTIEFVTPGFRLTPTSLQFLQQLYAATLGVITGESISEILDNSFGGEQGSIIYRDDDVWVALSLSEALDASFGADRGSVLYRGEDAWDALIPADDGKVLTTHGVDADPTWEVGGAAVEAGMGLTSTSTTTFIGTETVTISLDIPVAINHGGTAGYTPAQARTNLGAAPIDSPIFTGDPHAPTPAPGDSDTSIATTAFVANAISGVVGGGGGTYTPGSVLFAGTTGAIDQDNTQLFYDNTNNRLGIGTTTPEEALHVNGGIRFPKGIINAAGNLGINTTPPPPAGTGWGQDALESMFRIGGIYETDTDPVIFNIQGIWRSTYDFWPSWNMMAVIPWCEPRVSVPMSLISIQNYPSLRNSTTNVPAMTGIVNGWQIDSSYTGTVSAYYAISLGGPGTPGGLVHPIPTVRAVNIGVISTNNNRAEVVTTTQAAIHSAGMTTSTITTGSSAINYGLWMIMPSGGSSAGTTTNRGIFITGNGGTATATGVVTNHAIFNDSTAQVYLSAGRVGIKTSIPQSDLHIGTVTGTARIYRLFTDISNGEWAYLGDWGKVANVATYGTDMNGTGSGRSVAFFAGGLEAARILATGEVGIGLTTPLSRLQIGGTYTTANTNFARMNGTLVSSSTSSQVGFGNLTTFTPSGASVGGLYGSQSVAIISGTTTIAVPNLFGLQAYVQTNAGYAGTVAQGAAIIIPDAIINGTIPITAYSGILVSGSVHGNNLATGTVTNVSINLNGISAGSAGGTLANRAIRIVVPSGGSTSGATTNYGLYVTGNGGTALGGSVTNYAIVSDSTANIYINSTMILWGGPGTGNPAFKRSGTEIQIRLSDDSNYTSIAAITAPPGTSTNQLATTAFVTSAITAGPTGVFTPGSVLFGGATGDMAQDNANLFWNDTNNRLGIGTATPANTLHVNGEIVVDTALAIYPFDIQTNLSIYPGYPRSMLRLMNTYWNVGLSLDAIFPGINFNCYNDGTTKRAFGTDPTAAIFLDINDGTLRFSTVPSTGVGSAITDANQVNLTASGNFGIGTTTPQAQLQIGKTSATARIYNAYTDVNNGEWAYLGSWATSVAQYGSAMNGTGVARDVAFLRGGTEQLRLTSTGMLASVGINFGAATSAGPTDVSRHIALWGTTYGFNITSNRLNYLVTGAGASHAFYNGATPILLIGPTLVSFAGGTSAYPALKRNATTLEVRLADDTGFAPIAAVTAAPGTNTTQLATTAFVTSAITSSTGAGAFTAGSVLFGGASGAIAQDNANLFWDDTNNRLGIGTITPEASLHVAGIIRFPGGIINAAGELGINTTPPPAPGTGIGPDDPNALIRVGGIYNTSVSPVIVNIENIFRSSAPYAGHNLFAIIPQVEPQTASPVSFNSCCNNPVFANSAVNIPVLVGYSLGVNMLASYTGTLNTFNGISVNGITNAGPNIIPNYRGILVNQSTLNTGLTTGTSNTDLLWLNGITTASAGGTVNNNSLRLIVPSGGASAGSAVNRGIYITGNGGTASGTGTVTNHAIYNNSTANVYLSQGRVGIKNDTPSADLTIGGAASSARIHNVYNTAGANAEWAYLGDWTKTVNVATYGTDKVGTGVTRNIQFLVGGVDALNFGVTNANAWTTPNALKITAATGATNNAVLDVDAMVGNTAAKFGTTLPLYITAAYAGIAFNIYFVGGWKYGKGSTAHYGGYYQVNPNNGDTIFAATPAAGAADAAATTQNVFLVNRTGLVTFGPGAAFTAAFPAFKRNTTGIEVRLADDTAFTSISAITASPGTNTTQLATTEFVTAAVTTAAGGAYLPLTGGVMTGNISMAIAAGSGSVSIGSPAGQQSYISYYAGSSQRWILGRTNDAEAGSDAGSNLGLQRFTDAGGFLGYALYVERATGRVGLNFGVGQLPQASLDIHGPGGVNATARSYNTFTDASNGEWAYMGNWATNVAQYGSAMNGTGVARDVSFVRGGTEQLRLASAGMTAAVGLSFGAVVGASATDLSKHITLHTNGYGLSITSGRLNYVGAAGSGHAFYIGTASPFVIGGLGPVINGATSGSLTLSVPAVAGTNTITFPAGTTNFSTTGGTGRVVKQLTTGGALTVATLTSAELDNTQQLPTLLGTAALAGQARGVTIMGNYAYCGCQAVTPLHTFEIFDITIPTAPIKIGGIDMPAQSLGVPVIAGQIAYVGCNSATNNLQIVDISNPKLPVLIRGFTCAAVGLQYIAMSGSYLYTGNAGANALFRIYDVSDPVNPNLQSSMTMAGASGTRSIVLQGKYAFVGTGQAVALTGGLYTYDVSDPTNPLLVSTYNAATTISGLAAVGKYLYMAGATAAAGLQVLNIEDPATPVLVTTFALTAIPGVASNPIIAGNYLFITLAGANGLQVINITNPAVPVSVGVVSTVASGLGMALRGERLYILANSQLQVYDTMGVDIPTLRTGSINTDLIYVDGQASFNGDIFAQRSLIVGQAGILSRGLVAANQAMISGSVSAAAWTTSGIGLRVGGAGTVTTYTDTTSTGTIAETTIHNITSPTLASTNVLTVTQASTFRVNGAPVAGTNTTITNPFAFVVASGNSLFTSPLGNNITIQTAVGNGNDSEFIFQKSRNNAVITAGDDIGSMRFRGYDGTSYVDGASIVVRSGTIATGNIGAWMGFQTNAAYKLFLNWNNTVGVAGNTNPQAMLSVGTTAATARSYNAFTDANNGEWAYMGDWSASIARFGTDQNGTGVARDVSIMRGGVETIRLDANYALVYKTLNVVNGSWPTAYLTNTAAASNPALIINNSIAGYQSYIYYQDVGVGKWMIGKNTDNSWFMWDNTNGANFLGVTTTGQVGLGESGQLVIPKTGLVCFTGTTNAFPALKRSAAELQVRLADDSYYASLSSSYLSLNGSGEIASPYFGFGHYQNLLLWSEDFSNAAWQDAFARWSVTSTTTIAPNGSTTASTLSIDIAGALIRQTVTVTPGATYTFSIWARLGTATGAIGVDIGDGVGGSFQPTATWQRFKVVLVAGASAWLDLTPPSSPLGTYDFWGAQLEAGSDMGPYVRTQATAVSTAAYGIQATSPLTTTSSLTASSVTAIGSTAGLIFTDRVSGVGWQWYAQNGVARLWYSGSGDLFKIAITTGNTSIGLTSAAAASLNVASTARVYNAYIDASNGEWAYIGDWSGNVARYGSDQNGTGIARNIQFLVGGLSKLDFGVTTAGTWTSTAGLTVNGNLVAGSGVIGTTHSLNLANTSTLMIYSDTVNEVVMETIQTAVSATKYTLAINKYGSLTSFGGGLRVTASTGATDNAALNIDAVVGNTAAKFGTTLPLYITANTNQPTIGFNTYYSAGSLYGKGSSASYAGTYFFNTLAGEHWLTATNAAGNAAAAATLQTVAGFSRDGRMVLGPGATFTATFPSLKRVATELQVRLGGDTAFSPLASSVMAQVANEQAARIEFRSLTELTTIAAAATTNTVIQIPANAVVLAVSTRVTTVIPTAATYSVGITGTAGRYGAGISTAATTTSPGTLAGPLYYAAATAIVITPNLTPATATGVVRITIHYYLVTPPTS